MCLFRLLQSCERPLLEAKTSARESRLAAGLSTPAVALGARRMGLVTAVLAKSSLNK